MTYSFTVPLVPRGKGAARHGTTRTGIHVTYKDAKTENYMAAVATCAASALSGVRLDGPLKIDIVAVFPRTKELLRLHGRGPDKGKLVHGAGRIWCPQKPDKDNIDKAIFDSLKAWLRDDCKVVCGDTPKVYCATNEAPHVEVYILEPPPVDLYFVERGWPLPCVDPNLPIGMSPMDIREEDLAPEERKP
mgnify:CR=1 FL=1